MAGLDQLTADFRRAQKAFDKAVLDLQRALDAQAAAQADVSVTNMTRFRLRARDAQRDALAAFEPMETARRAYWQARAAQAEEQLRGLMRWHFSAYHAALRAAGITRPDALEDFGRRVATLETVIPVDLGGEVPTEPIDSEALNRADDEVF